MPNTKWGISMVLAFIMGALVVSLLPRMGPNFNDLLDHGDTQPQPLSSSLTDSGWTTVLIKSGPAKSGIVGSETQKEKKILGANRITTEDTVGSKSQAGQDVVVAAIFEGEKNGYFIDLASNDPVRFSNTRVLERDFGWDGICVEPSHLYLWGNARRKCLLVMAPVWDVDGKEVYMSFEERGIGKVGTQDRLETEQQLPGGGSNWRYTATLNDILDVVMKDNIVQIDYMSLDIESHEYIAMKNFNFSKYSISVLTVERPDEKLQALLRGNGFEMIHVAWGWTALRDELWMHKDFPDFEAAKKRAAACNHPKARDIFDAETFNGSTCVLLSPSPSPSPSEVHRE